MEFENPPAPGNATMRKNNQAPVVTILLAIHLVTTPGFASQVSPCEDARRAAVENILDDEGLLDDLNDESRSAIIGWASTRLDEYSVRCGAPVSMRAFGLRVKEGMRVIDAIATTGETHRASWLYRARLISRRQLHALKKLRLSSDTADQNACAIMATLTATSTTTPGAPRRCRPS